MILTQIAVTTLGSGLVFVGLREAVAPRAGARGYGVPIAADAPPTPYLEVKANRDIALGGLLVLLAFTSTPAVIAATLGIATLCPAWDAALVLHYGRPRDAAIHLVTAGYSLLAALLAIGGR